MEDGDTSVWVSLMDPDHHFLYVHQLLPDVLFNTIRIVKGGYVYAEMRDSGPGIIDREGVFHTYDEDLSTLPGLDELRFGCIGSGYLIDQKRIPNGKKTKSVRVIRSFDGSREVTSVRITPDTRSMDGLPDSGSVIDLSQAKPVGFRETGIQAEITGEDEIRDMGNEGVIVVNKLFEKNRPLLLFEKDGVKIYWHWSPDETYCEVLNENPGNKKATFILKEVLHDGIFFKGTGGSAYSVKAGSSKTVGSFIYTEDDFRSILHPYLAELPLAELTFHFTVQIGSNTETVAYTRKIRLSSYSEDRCPIYTVFRVQDEQDIVLGIQNRTEKTLDAGRLWGYAQCEWDVNGERYGRLFDLTIPPDSMVIVHFDSIDSVYKELELPNGTPLEVSLAVPVPGTELSGGEENMIIINCGTVGE